MLYYTASQINEYLQLFNIKKIITKSKKKIKYYNIPCTFDIETTSCYKDLNTGNILEANKVANMKEKQGKHFDDNRYKKLAFMYIWQLDIDDNIIIGRTWDELLNVTNSIVEYFNLSQNQRLIIYVRNLSFEFQFIRKQFNFIKVFATEKRQPIYAVTSNGLEFKCSYFLSGVSLETTGKNLVKYKASKMVGDLDYSKIRTPATPLTETELGYCLYDVIVDNHYIRECMEAEKGQSLLKIPLTKTGYVRRYVKNYCFNEFNRMNYLRIIERFKLDKKSYLQLKRLFSGGFTHANAVNSGLIFENVQSYDFTSSYPAVLLLEKYPMGSGQNYQPKSLQDFYKQLKSYCCVFDIEFTNIRQKPTVYENIISESKCYKLENHEVNNGRIVRASRLITTLNEIDFTCISQFYDWDEIKVINFKRYTKGYLPKPLLECCLKFYKDKTTLKDVKGKEIEYNSAKANVNSIYGMMVTDPIKDLITYDGDNWGVELQDIDEAIEQYNNSRSRFLAYEWGVWITSYARRNLYTGIIELGPDYIYSDTDSVKFMHPENHQEYFKKYNDMIKIKIKNVCDFYQFNVDDFSPKTVKGKVKTIGIWDDDGLYSQFKTLGAKRYMVEYAESKEVNITVSGINKKKAVPYILQESKKKNISPFVYFDDDMYIPCDYCGKLLHGYIDEAIESDIIDYQGIKYHIKEKSATHLENSAYSLSLSQAYIDYLKGVRQKESK